MTEGGYFLLNDHRAVDIDSRQFGEIKKDALLGKVILVIRWKGF
jgi:type IV secretory pathway protease TraF